MTECVLPDCSKPAKTRGLCSTHYTRFLKHGDPYFTAQRGRKPTGTVQEKFDRGHGGDDGTGCWPWLRPQRSGYPGTINMGQYRQEPGHRVSVILRDGGIPEGREVHHICQNRACVNPDHLEVLTVAEHHERHAKKGI